MSRSVDDISRRMIRLLLARLRSGRVEIFEPGNYSVFGEDRSADPVTARLRVNDPHFYTAFFRGSAGLAESYREGEWDCDDLTSLVRIGARNMPVLDRARAVYRVVDRPVRWLSDLVEDARRHRDRTARHYNLGNDLFAAMLDETMAYSSAVFAHPGQSLAAAQIEKFDRVCRKLELKPGDRLLEIGTGWGTFAMHAASQYGCDVTTTTISHRQAELARERIEAAGLSDRITVVERDFAELTGSYDKLASIEMIETVGWRRFDEFFRTCDRLLEPDGLMCHQIITIDDAAFHAEKLGRSFINTLIFEGGSLPSERYIAGAINRLTDMRPLGSEDITAHYPETLRHWRARFNAASEELRSAGYDERFARIWNLYLAYCEAGFIERRICVGQSVWAKPQYSAGMDSPASALEHA